MLTPRNPQPAKPARRWHARGLCTLAVAALLATGVAACGSNNKTTSSSSTTTTANHTAPTVPYIAPGTKPKAVALTASCAKAVAPVNKMIVTMHSGALLSPADLKILNTVLRTAPRLCTITEYRNWQYKELLPWMRTTPLPSRPAVTPTTKPAAKGHTTTGTTRPAAKKHTTTS